MGNSIRKLKIRLFLLVAVAGLTPSIATALINGNPLEGYPDLVRLVFVDGTMCTGAYIDKFTILTAAHCLIKNDAEAFHRVEKILSVNDRPLSVEHVRNIVHPKFDHSWWPNFDVGLIKTSANGSFHGDFKISKTGAFRTGQARLFGCGISEFSPKMRTRASGENAYFRIGNVLLFVGASRNDPQNINQNTSVAPNDSGGPILTLEGDEIIGISTKATAKISAEYRLPALSIGTSIMNSEVLDFINSELQAGGKNQ